VYFKLTNGCNFIISVHVDDYIMGYEDGKYFGACIAHLHTTIKMTVEKEIDCMLQINLEWTENSACFSQNRQIDSMKKRSMCVHLHEFSRHPWKRS